MTRKMTAYEQAIADVLRLDWLEHDAGGWTGCAGFSVLGRPEYLSMDDLEKLFEMRYTCCGEPAYFWEKEGDKFMSPCCHLCGSRGPVEVVVRRKKK